MNDPFAPSTENREPIPASKNKEGFLPTQEPHEYINQAIFKGVTDHIWGTSAQASSDDATFYTDASGNPLDKTASAVTINEDDKILIAHDVAATANMTLICGGKKVRLEMLQGVNWNLSTFDLTLGETGDSFSGDIELTGTGALTIEESNDLNVHHTAMTVVNPVGHAIMNGGIQESSGTYSFREKLLTWSGWNMNTTPSLGVTHGLILDDIVDIGIIVIRSTGVKYKIDSLIGGIVCGVVVIGSTDATMSVTTGGLFQTSSEFNNSSGFIFLKYKV